MPPSPIEWLPSDHQQEQANVSRHEAMSHERMLMAETQLAK
jgi:hypothetical protein